MKIVLVTTLAFSTIVGCDGGQPDPDRPFGDTAVVVLVSPPENTGNTAEPPAFVGTAKQDVLIDAEPGGDATTDMTGLAVVRDVVAGSTEFVFEGGPSLSLDILRDGDVYDAAVAYDGERVAFYPGFPIRYGVGGDIVEIQPDDDATQALNTDDTIVFFDGGTHVGNLVIEGENVILFGESLGERSVVVDGDVEVRGGHVRIRGVTITGTLTVFGNNFGMAFSLVQGATQLNGQAISFLQNTFCGDIDVPSSNAALYANLGIDAELPAPAEECAP